MFITPDENGKYSSKKIPNRLMLTMRIVIGVYLYYLIFQLRESFLNPYENIFIILACIAFAIAATLVIISSLSKLNRGYYQGGALDADVIEDEFYPHNVVFKRKE